MGRHALTEVPMDGVIDYLQALFYAQLLYTCCICFIKAAILSFYWRLFSVKNRIPILIVSGVVVAWFFAIFLAVIFTCEPINAQWNILITDRKCIKTRTIWLSGSIVNVLTDAVLLVMPLPYVWSLHAPVPQRIALGCMFMLGCFVSVVSIVRLTVLMSLDLSSKDSTFNFSEVVIWSVVEIHCGMICSCLPSLRPAIKLLGLQCIFGSISSHPRGQSDSNGRATPGPGSDALRSWKHPLRKLRSPYTITDLSTYHPNDEEEDSYEMIRKANEEHGLATTAVEPARSSVSEDRSLRTDPDIEVKRGWTVMEEDVQGSNKV
ncbi:hypothetical protein EJ03DRAFT_78296 [Teratosphaeria nubilosa]|uniref:Rhodopsin domain-containing protein n=1 Tax=Teratosphaeria nubilosa TaxID=161662 RepID=A0A6G1LDP4_9PEZI|nr:hypothetical protein EJ03DRAFT_78296 [Teratosphaeria nubilosa]